MKYKLTLLFILIFLGVSTVWTQTGAKNKTIELKARDYLQAIIKQDAPKILKYTNPQFIRELGGGTKTLRFINKELREMQAMFRLVSAEVSETKDKKVSTGSEVRVYVTVKFTSQLFGDEAVEVKGFLKVAAQNKNLYFLQEKGIVCSFHIMQCAAEEEEKEKTTGSGVGRGTGAGNGSGTPPSTEKDKTASTDKVDLKIIKRVAPEYTPEARNAEIQGTVLLRLTIDKKGNVTAAKPIKGLSHGLTEKAIEAALLMKFAPPTRNGKSVSNATVTMELSFSTLQN